MPRGPGAGARGHGCDGGPDHSGEKRLAAPSVYSPRSPIFADEDLDLVKLLADQAAVILDSRALIDEAARVQAREEATRMKDDFLSAAAHDLKTPLTTLVVQSELLSAERRGRPRPPPTLMGCAGLPGRCIASKILCLSYWTRRGPSRGSYWACERKLILWCVRLRSAGGTIRSGTCVSSRRMVLWAGCNNLNRISQLLENLVENAVKYSPGGGTVEVRLWRTMPDDGRQTTDVGRRQATVDDGRWTVDDGRQVTDGIAETQSPEGWNHITVSDQGIGIPGGDLGRIFERFHRGSNVDDRSFSGMGLGLFICKGIVEQHGGKIWVEPPLKRAANGNGTGNGNGREKNDGGGIIYGTNGGVTGEDGTGPVGGTVGIGNGIGPGTTIHVVLPLAPVSDISAPALRADG